VRKKIAHNSRIIKKQAEVTAIEYVLPLGGNGWVVKNSNAKTFTVITDSKQEAIIIARNIAKTKHIELVVHGRNGRIERRESYVS
jgi:hypothetical protein